MTLKIIVMGKQITTRKKVVGPSNTTQAQDNLEEHELPRSTEKNEGKQARTTAEAILTTHVTVVIVDHTTSQYDGVNPNTGQAVLTPMVQDTVSKVFNASSELFKNIKKHITSPTFALDRDVEEIKKEKMYTKNSGHELESIDPPSASQYMTKNELRDLLAQAFSNSKATEVKHYTYMPPYSAHNQKTHSPKATEPQNSPLKMGRIIPLSIYQDSSNP